MRHFANGVRAFAELVGVKLIAPKREAMRLRGRGASLDTSFVAGWIGNSLSGAKRALAEVVEARRLTAAGPARRPAAYALAGHCRVLLV
jgi:hypothetical protein